MLLGIDPEQQARAASQVRIMFASGKSRIDVQVWLEEFGFTPVLHHVSDGWMVAKDDGEVAIPVTAPPTEVAGIPVTSFDDLEQGSGGLPPTDGLRFALASGARVIVRPSGTEPKVKLYGEGMAIDPGPALDELAALLTPELTPS